MELVLEKSLEHQQRAVDAVADVFAGVRIDAPAQYYANPVLDLADPNLIANVAAVQAARNVPSEMRGATKYPHAYLPPYGSSSRRRRKHVGAFPCWS